MEDELGISPEKIQELSGSVVEEADTEDSGDISLEADIELPENPFWGEEGSDQEDAEAPDSDDSEPDAESDVSEDGHSQTIKYKANGEDVELTLEEAQKRLAMTDPKVVRKAFTDRTKLRKENEKLASENKELAEYRETWNKLEAVKDDEQKLYEMITGKSFEDFERNAAERKQLFEEASPEEQRAMRAEDRLRQLENKSVAEQKGRDKERTDADKKLFQAEKVQLQGQLEREYHKHATFDEKNPQVANRLKKMLWRNAVADLKDYHESYGKLTSKMVKKAFSDNSAALAAFRGNAEAATVTETATQKKAAAKTKAEEASTRNYSSPNMDMKGLKPEEYFYKFIKRNR